MKITKRTLAGIHAASTDPTRFNLRALHFESDGIIATNGYSLIRIASTESVTGEVPKLEAFSLGADRIADLAKRLGKNRSAEIDVEATNGSGPNGSVFLTFDDGEKAELPKLVGDFPNWRQVVPTEAPEYTVAISCAVLEQVIAAARQWSDTRKASAKSGGNLMALKFEFGDSEKLGPIRITCDGDSRHDNEDTRLEAVVMPCRK